MKKKTLSIPSIKSNNCAEKISQALYSYPEIEDIIIDIDEKKIELILNTDISNNELKNIIKSIGNYDIEEII